MACSLDSYCQMPLLAFGQTGLFAAFNLSVLVDVALQCLVIFVVKIGYICSVFKNLCHTLLRSILIKYICVCFSEFWLVQFGMKTEHKIRAVSKIQ